MTNLETSRIFLHLARNICMYVCMYGILYGIVDSVGDRGKVRASLRQVDISTESQSAVCSLRGQTPAVRDRKNARVPALLTHIPRVTSVARFNVARFSRPSNDKPRSRMSDYEVTRVFASHPIVEIYIIVETYVVYTYIYESELIRDNGVR